MKEENRSSYTSASSFPIKILHNDEIVGAIIEERIKPAHVQLAPTNRCNLNCSFCSCSEVDKKQEWTQDTMNQIIQICNKLNVGAATITGGGEPTLFPHINELINKLYSNGTDIGLVSNGLKLDNINHYSKEAITWARISFGHDRVWNQNLIDNLDRLNEGKNIDMAFSYVIAGNKPNQYNIESIMKYATEKGFTHVRFVDDILNPDSIRIRDVQGFITKNNLDPDGIAIYQERQEFEKGAERCLISLLKPLIAPDGFVYPCCGVQYALPNETKNFPESMRMGHFTELKDIIENQKCFEGSVCKKCYYTGYNDLMNKLQKDIQHERFV